MPLNAEASLGLIFGDQRCEEEDGRSLQSRIGLDLCRYVPSVSLRHHDVQQDQIRLEIPGTLMRFSGVALLQHEIAASLFEKDLGQVGAVPVVINNQDASLFSDRRPRHTEVSRAGTLAVVSQFKGLSTCQAFSEC